LVQGDQDLGGTGVENVNKVASGGDLGCVNEDIESTEVLTQELLSLGES
jgi:hypothetical protein